jgi:hypothetical protein
VFFKRSWIANVVVLAMAIIMFTVPAAVAQAKPDHQPPGARVAATVARQAAAWQVLTQLNSEVNGGHWANKRLQVGRVVDVHDPDAGVVAYLVDVLADGQPDGWVMVSAFLDEEPIIMWGEGGHAFRTDKVKGRLGRQADDIVSDRVLWLGGPLLAAEFQLKDGTSRTIAADGTERSGTPKGWTKVHTVENPHARQFWGIVKKMQLGAPGETNPADGVTDIDPATWEPTPYTLYREYISATDGLNQQQWQYDGYNWTGCAPTAGSNIMAYWASQGYPNLNPTGNQEDVVMELRTTMGTYQDSSGNGVTQPYNIDDGLAIYARQQGYADAFGYNYNLPQFSTVKARIDDMQPVLLNTSGNSYFGGGHTVFVVGYKQFYRSGTLGTTTYLVFRNNQNDGEHNLYIKWGAWSTWSITTFIPQPNP